MALITPTERIALVETNNEVLPFCSNGVTVGTAIEEEKSLWLVGSGMAMPGGCT